MPCVLFVQGAGPDVHDQWDNHLVQSLQGRLGADYEIRYPRMPDEADPAYPAWKAQLLLEIERLPPGSFLAGHSLGATFLIHAVSADPPDRAVGGIFLIAPPFVGDNGWQSDEIEPRDRLGPGRGIPVFLYRGGNDDTVPLDHVALYRKSIPTVIVRLLPGRDHQLGNDLAEVADDIRSLGGRDTPSGY